MQTVRTAAGKKHQRRSLVFVLPETQVEKRWPERSYFLLLLRRVARVVRREAACTRPYLQSYSETHGFRATRRSLGALPLKVESRSFRANVSLLGS